MRPAAATEPPTAATEPPIAGGRAAFAAGRGAIAIEARADGRSVITRAWAQAPLVVLEPRGRGGAAWVVAGTLGGGLVDGDRVELDVAVGAGAAAVLATQAQTKVYRGASAQALTVWVGAGGLFVCAPDPVACFAGARYRQDARVALDDGASLVWIDGLTCGRRAHGERWAFASYASRVVIERAGEGGAGMGGSGAPARALLRDGLVLDTAHADIAARLGRFDALATIVALGPRAAEVAASLVDTAAGASMARGADVRITASALAGEPRGAMTGVIARIAGTGVEPVVRAVRALCAPLAVALGDDPFRGR